MKISLLTGGGDRPYVLGLLSCLLSEDIDVDFIGSDELFEPDLMNHPRVVFYNLRGDQNPEVPLIKKVIRVITYYFRLIGYAYKTDSGLFHIVWFNKFIYFDRTIMNVYYKMLGKKIVHTAHNIDQQERDGKSTVLNRFTLKIMYNMFDHVFVHTSKMKEQLIAQFNVDENKISVIPFGVNDTIPVTMMSKTQAREKLNLFTSDKVILFFGNIAPYKGLEYLLMAMPIIKKEIGQIKLIIAGRVKDSEPYWRQLQIILHKYNLQSYIQERIGFVPDGEIEVYYKAADALVLPYRHIYQSGVLFLSYNFGLPVIATDVGSLREDIIKGETGFLCNPEDSSDLAEKIIMFFKSSMYENADNNRDIIIGYAKEKYSWDTVGEITAAVYEKISR